MPLTNMMSGYGRILERYSKSSKTFYIFSPFISNSALEKLLGEKQNVVIVTSWREDHLLSGASHLELYPLCKSKGWTLFINSRLHSKLYSDGLMSAYVGSANCTERALYSEDGNIESLVFLPDTSVESKIEMNTIINDSILVDDDVYNLFLQWFKRQEIVPIEIVEPIPELISKRKFSIMELPALNSPLLMKDYLESPEELRDLSMAAEHDVALFGGFPRSAEYSRVISIVSKRFFSHPFIKKIDEYITIDGLYFGKFRALVQEICTDVPVPYRRDLTYLVQNLINWFVILKPEVYGTERPNYSQCIFRKQ